MDQSPRLKKILLFTPFMLLLLAASCMQEQYTYRGPIRPGDHPWLANRKIFVDPGHGGLGKSDILRIGPNGVTEEEANLRVGLILEDLLMKAGAKVKMSRRRDIDIHLDERIKDAWDFKPELLVSIHHNNSMRKDDATNYPFVFFWGSRFVRPESFDFAVYLQDELNKIMDVKGRVLSDFSVFGETGTRILRETRYLCPGALGEGGFFTDRDHAVRLKDIHYNEHEAEAYFNAISLYFKRGIPTAEVIISCPVEDVKGRPNLIKEKHPRIAIVINGDCEKPGIEPGSLTITLDNVPISAKRIFDDVYQVEYGNVLYPGGHSIKFQFRNLRNQNSMLYHIPLIVDVNTGDYHRLREEGSRLLNDRGTVVEGLKMLLSAYSIEKADPDADRVLYDIARGFFLIGDIANSEYYYNKIYYFYPQSTITAWKSQGISQLYGYRHPVEYHGKRAELTGNIDIDKYFRDSREYSFEQWMKKYREKLYRKFDNKEK